jgi:hypothetical protein
MLYFYNPKKNVTLKVVSYITGNYLWLFKFDMVFKGDK